MLERRQRRVPRQSVGWSGTCALQDDPNAGPVECRVLDISVIGVGIEVHDAVPNGLVGRSLAVDCHAPVGRAVSIHIVGEVRNTTPCADGGTRIGMEFVDLSDTERSILDAIEMMHVSW